MCNECAGKFTERFDGRQAKPGSNCFNYVLSISLECNVLFSPSFCGLFMFLSVKFTKFEYPRGMGMG